MLSPIYFNTHDNNFQQDFNSLMDDYLVHRNISGDLQLMSKNFVNFLLKLGWNFR